MTSVSPELDFNEAPDAASDYLPYTGKGSLPGMASRPERSERWLRTTAPLRRGGIVAYTPT